MTRTPGIFHTGVRMARDLASGPIARASAVSLVIRVSGLALSFAQAVLTARLLGADGYGIVAVVMSVVGIAATACQFGFGALAVREIAARMAAGDKGGVRAFVRTALWTVILTSFAAGVTLTAVTWTNRAVQGHYRDALALGAFLVMPLALLGLLRGFAQGFGRIGLAQVPGELVRPGGLILLMGAAAALGTDFATADYMLATTVAAFLSAAIGAVWLWQREKAWLSGSAVTSETRIHAAALPFFGLALASMLQGELNTLLLGWLAGARETGLFQPVVRLTPVLTLATQAAGMRYAPRVAEFWQRGEIDRIRAVTATFTWTTTLATLGASFVIAAAGPRLMRAFGPEFCDSAPLLWYVAAGQVFNAACGPFGILFGMARRTGVAVHGQLLGLTANVLTGVILIPNYGALGAALGTVAGVVVWNVFLLFKARKMLEIDPSLLGSWRIARRKG